MALALPAIRYIALRIVVYFTPFHYYDAHAPQHIIEKFSQQQRVIQHKESLLATRIHAAGRQAFCHTEAQLHA